jgi:hypothetical protein
MQPETISEKELIPTKFEPIRKNRFILQFVNDKNESLIDSFMVKNILSKPTQKKKWFNKNTQTTKCEGNLIVEFHSVISPSTSQQIVELINYNKTFYIIEKILDPKGTEISLREYKHCKIKQFNLSDLGYDVINDQYALETITVAFSPKEMQLHY